MYIHSVINHMTDEKKNNLIFVFNGTEIESEL